MPQSLAQITIHIVFSTKHRQPLLTQPDLRGRVHAYLAGTARELDCPSIRTGGTEDHVHMLCSLSRTMNIGDLVRDIKRASTTWINEEKSLSSEFHWQSGYGAFSVSPSHVDPLCRYIAHQDEHHRKESFQDEFRRLLRKYKIEYDERYVWD